MREFAGDAFATEGGQADGLQEGGKKFGGFHEIGACGGLGSTGIV
jgi:hypothetical protein